MLNVRAPSLKSRSNIKLFFEENVKGLKQKKFEAIFFFKISKLFCSCIFLLFLRQSLRRISEPPIRPTKSFEITTNSELKMAAQVLVVFHSFFFVL
jgi:hypothetical protein